MHVRLQGSLLLSLSGCSHNETLSEVLIGSKGEEKDKTETKSLSDKSKLRKYLIFDHNDLIHHQALNLGTESVLFFIYVGRNVP